MNNYVRDRILIPFGIPVAVMITVGFVIVNLSRVLLTLTKNGAVVVGTVTSAAILFGAAYAAAPRHHRRSKVGITLLVVFALGTGVAGAWAANRGEREFHKAGGNGTHGTPTPGATGTGAPSQADVTVELVAKDIKFDKTTLEFPAGKTVDLHLFNRDSTIHNFALFSDKAKSQVVFRGDTFGGPSRDEHNIFEAPAAGTYYFHCDVHPTMEGTVTVA